MSNNTNDSLQIHSETLEKPSGHDAADNHSLTCGEQLKKARLANQMTVQDVSDRMKVPESYIVSIENDHFNQLPGLVFARGYVRQYAALLNLDANQVVQLLNQQTGKSRTYTPNLKTGQPLSSSRTMPPLLAWTGSLTTIIVVGIISYFSWNYSNREVSPNEDQATYQPLEPAIQTENNNAQPAPPVLNSNEPEDHSASQSINAKASMASQPPPPVASTQEFKLTASFFGKCWVQIKDTKGNILYTGKETAGSTINLNAPNHATIRLGNLKAVSELTFDGHPIALNNITVKNGMADITLTSNLSSGRQP